MIDEALQDLASLYVLGMLEGPELTAFQARLGRDRELSALVLELTETMSQLAYLQHSPTPPAALRERVFDKIDTALRWRAEQNRGMRIAFPTWIPWAAAAALALSTAWFGQQYLASRSESALLRDQKNVAEFELMSARNQIKAERLIAQHQIGNTSGQVAALQKEIDAAKQQADLANTQLASAQKLIAARDIQLALASDRASALESKAKHDADLANFKISTLASLLGNTPQALAVAVWNPARQEGVLRVEKLPALAEDKDYQLWLVDPQYSTPVDGGVFTVDPSTGEARVQFKAGKPIRSVAKFAVSLERKGGVSKAEGPMVLLSQ